MALQRFSNNASTTLASNLNTGETTMTVSASALFSPIGVDEFESVTLVSNDNDVEIVHVTGRSGNTWTIVREQEGTTALPTWVAGTTVQGRTTAASLQQFSDFVYNYVAPAPLITDLASLDGDGDPRGLNAINFQTYRTLPANVGSGDYSINIGSGYASVNASINIGDGGYAGGAITSSPINIGSGQANGVGSTPAINIGSGGAEGPNSYNIGDGGAYYNTTGNTFNVGSGGAYADNAYNFGDGGAYALNSLNIGAGGAYNVNTINLGSGAAGEGAVNIGWGTGASGIRSVIIGNAEASDTDSMAFGNNANSPHLRSIALGSDTLVTEEDQVMLGARNIEVTGTDKGFVSQSPDGTRYRITVDNLGRTTVRNLTTGLIVPPREREFTITDGVTPDINIANGDIHIWTLTANRSPTITLDSGHRITLMITAGTFSVTWPSITWVGGSAPVLSTTEQTIIEFWKVGLVIYGVHVGDAA